MTNVANRVREHETQPLDAVDHFLRLQNLPYQRKSADLVEIDAVGHWTDYHVALSAGHANLARLGQDERVELMCVFATRMPETRRAQLSELMHMMNKRLPIGHFEIADNRKPTFRYTVLTDMLGDNAGLSMANLVEQSLSICDHYFPIFQMVAWSDTSPRDALELVDFESAGSA